jgi:2-polyprenyl-3-methyl-5-hydroxy-6-metoxy-1,4-benzoquinol methylase
MDYLAENKAYYDQFYRSVTPRQIAEKVRHRNAFLSGGALPPSWEGLYWGGFRRYLKGARILEIGAGDGLNSLIMAALGAGEVVAVDITYHTKRIIVAAAKRLMLSKKVVARTGDFTGMDFELASFDFVVGKSILRHLPLAVEENYVHKAAVLLKPTGEMRFSEPVPSHLDSGMEYLYPQRDSSPAHYRVLCSRYFEQVQLIPVRRMRQIRARVIIARDSLVTPGIF